MTRHLTDYVALALIRNRDADEFFAGTSDISGDLEEVRKRAEQLCGFRLSERLFNKALRTLADCGLVRITDDEYSGTFVKVKCSGLEGFFQRASSDLAKAIQDYGEVGAILQRPSDYPAAGALLKHELLEDYQELGSEWLTRALAGLRERIGPEGTLDDLVDRTAMTPVMEAPASDRTVSLTDNQQISLESASSELITLIEKENSIDGDVKLRGRLIAELKAGRELVRGQSVRAYLLYLTVIAALTRLIETYGPSAIGVAAKKLLELYIEHVIGK